MRGTSSRGRWLVLALFLLGGAMVGGLFLARGLLQPAEVRDGVHTPTTR